MNSAWLAQRFISGRRSTCSTSAASQPMPTWNVKYRPFAEPTPIDRIEPCAMASRFVSAASIGSSESPSAREKTLVLPPGSAATAQSVPTNPFATSLRVPSPPSTITTSVPVRAAPSASWVA